MRAEEIRTAIRTAYEDTEYVCLECDEEVEYGHDPECSQTLGAYPPALAVLIREELSAAHTNYLIAST